MTPISQHATESSITTPASAAAAAAPEAQGRRQYRSWLAELVFAPFNDVDERVKSKR